ncbi:MAG TPA: FAD-dependent monooxygenase [Ktedonobacterales bacterium]
MRITILGGGPAGLYCGLLLKKANPAHDVRIIERNAPDATYGWGVVFSDRTLAAFQEADYKSYKSITNRFVSWDAIDTWYRGELTRCGGHVFAGLSRRALLGVLQERCRELGVTLEFAADVTNLESLGDVDLLVAADGVNSLARRTHEAVFRPSLMPGAAKYIWLGADKVLDAFTFIFKESEYGLFQVHSYPFSGETSTFIVECADEVWRQAGLDQASEEESIAFCERLFAHELRGARLMSNSSKWINFATLKCARWHAGNVALVGDAAHTAHFSIGSGTKLAMEDAIALANAVEQYADLERALTEYELARRPVVELFQAAAAESQSYFEHVRRYTSLPPSQFVFNLLTRSKRITYDDLRLRDPRFSDWVDRSAASLAGPSLIESHKKQEGSRRTTPQFVPPPAFTGFTLAGARLQNRIAARLGAEDGWQGAEQSGAALLVATPIAISAEARIGPYDPCLYSSKQAEEWRLRLDHWRVAGVKVCATLNHAGRRGATRLPAQGADIPDRPLREGAWSLVSASPIPYTPVSQTPRQLDCDGMRAIRDDFVKAAGMADECGFDMLMLHMAHGYLLASFLSPLSNQRADEYGGSLKRRIRFPLEVFEAVREVWPVEKPLAVALTCHDGARGGLTQDDAVAIARALKERGCDLLQPLAGQTTPDAELPYGKGFLTPLSERIRTEVGMATLVGGYLTTMNEANTILAGGRADLVLMTPLDATAAKG